MSISHLRVLYYFLNKNKLPSDLERTAENYLITEAIETMVDIDICEETDSFVALVPHLIYT